MPISSFHPTHNDPNPVGQSIDLPDFRASNSASNSAPNQLHGFAEADIHDLRQSLLCWYGESGRDLPWRRTRDPYAIWISEIMLQQTQVKTVIPYYDRWLKHFPTIAHLAKADQQQVLKAWQGLGYYARARNLHRAAQVIVAEQGGEFPQDLESVVALPGIGQTTAGGILSAAFNQAVPILDGNVKRVLARLRLIEVPPSQAIKPLWQISAALLDPEQPRDFNQEETNIKKEK